MSKLRVNIDGIEVTGYKGQTILQLAMENGIEIPNLCHDNRLKVHGGCGLCVVEVEGTPKLGAWRLWPVRCRGGGNTKTA